MPFVEPVTSARLPSSPRSMCPPDVSSDIDQSVNSVWHVMCSAWDVAPRDVLVDARLRRKAEHPLADDVALHLVRPAGDAVAGCAEHVLVPLVRAPLARVGGELGAEHGGHRVRHDAHPLGPQQLAERAFRAGGLAGTAQVGGPSVEEALDLLLRVGPGELLAHDWILGHAHRPGRAEQLRPRAADAPLTAGAGVVALEAQCR